MVAEYQPAQNKYYFYTTDQINSTRLVTDENGNVVYAAVHDPYGGIHHTWANAFDPVWKFSGKEQDAESGLYYFGARYYDPTLYRFLGPDPVIGSVAAMANPQFWNLYSYCGNNPIRFFDPDGQSFVIFLGSAGLLFVFDQNGNLVGVFFASNNVVGKNKYGRNKPFENGIWERIDYKSRSDESVGDTGIYLFDHFSEPPGAKGLHAGRRDKWWYPTFGCIRTQSAAMELINRLERDGDALKHLIVINDTMFDKNGFFDLNGIMLKLELYMKSGNYSAGIRNKVLVSLYNYLWNLFGPFNFMYDYFLNSESPIPADAF